MDVILGIGYQITQQEHLLCQEPLDKWVTGSAYPLACKLTVQLVANLIIWGELRAIGRSITGADPENEKGGGHQLRPLSDV